MTNLDRDLVAAALPSYEVGAELGRGRWGVVLSGRHRQLGRDVAIKQLPRAFSADPSVRERFLAEARLLAGLTHPHVVPVYDYVEHEGLCLLVMEQLTGGTVADRSQQGALDAPAACATVLAACAGLHQAHELGVLHRDVKPENLLLSADDVVKVADFGIAKVLVGEVSMGTPTGVVLGTPVYMAPEQALDRPVGPQADIYAVGSMLYELLAERLPFSEEGGPLEILSRHAHEDPLPLTEAAPDVPDPIAEAVMVSLAREPEDRYDNAEDFAVALGEAGTAAWGPGWLEDTGVPLMASGRILASTVRDTPRPRQAPDSGPEPQVAAHAADPLTEDSAEPAAASDEDGGADGWSRPQRSPASETIVKQIPRADAEASARGAKTAKERADREPAQPDEGVPAERRGTGGARRRTAVLAALGLVLVLVVTGAAVLAFVRDEASLDESPATNAAGEAGEAEAGEAEVDEADDAEADDADADGGGTEEAETGEASAALPEPEGTILFVSDRDGENDVFAVEPDTGEERNLTARPSTNDRQATWSGERDRIVFSSDRPGDFAIHTMNPDGSDVTQVTSGLGTDRDPVMSPDGERIAFSSRREASRSIYLIDVDGTGLTRLTDDGGEDMRPTWSPDGTHLAFHRVHEDDQRIDIFVTEADPDAAPVNVTDRAGRDFHPSWSPAEPVVVFASDRDGPSEDVFAIDVTEVLRGREPGTPRNVTDDPDSDDWDPDWGPNAQWIAFQSDRTDESSDVYIMRSDGTDVRPITNTPATDADPGW